MYDERKSTTPYACDSGSHSHRDNLGNCNEEELAKEADENRAERRLATGAAMSTLDVSSWPRWPLRVCPISQPMMAWLLVDARGQRRHETATRNRAIGVALDDLRHWFDS